MSSTPEDYHLAFKIRWKMMRDVFVSELMSNCRIPREEAEDLVAAWKGQLEDYFDPDGTAIPRKPVCTAKHWAVVSPETGADPLPQQHWACDRPNLPGWTTILEKRWTLDEIYFPQKATPHDAAAPR